MNPLPGSLEWWHVVVGLASTLIGIGLSVFGQGFKAWSSRLNEMSERFDNRLASMEEASQKRWNDVERKMEHHDRRIHDLHIQVERRVTFIEARLNGHPDKS